MNIIRKIIDLTVKRPYHGPLAYDWKAWVGPWDGVAPTGDRDAESGAGVRRDAS